MTWTRSWRSPDAARRSMLSSTGKYTYSTSLPRASCLTWFIHWLVLESHLPHKIVNLLFAITNSNVELKMFWGSRLSKADSCTQCVRKNQGWQMTLRRSGLSDNGSRIRVDWYRFADQGWVINQPWFVGSRNQNVDWSQKATAGLSGVAEDCLPGTTMFWTKNIWCVLNEEYLIYLYFERRIFDASFTTPFLTLTRLWFG